MNQAETIDALIKRNTSRSELSAKIQSSYETYLRTGNSSLLNQLLSLIDEYCEFWVIKQLRNGGITSNNEADDILQESRLAVWNNIEKDRKTGNVHTQFANFCFGMYKHKTVDKFRSCTKDKKNIDADGFEAISEDQPISKGEIQGATPSIDIFLEQEQLRQLYENLFIQYCSAMVNSNAYPGRHLALYYARILPHLNDAIKNTKAASAKWAFTKMGNRTCEVLSNSSQRTLTLRIHESLKWCDAYVRQLNQVSDIKGNDTLLKDIIYTAVYNTSKIEDWSESMHTSVLKNANRLIALDKELNQALIDYAGNSDKVLSKFMKGASR